LKFEFSKGSVSGRNFGEVDIPIVRFADVYLMRAEAKLRKNDAAGALADVNLVRTSRTANIAGSALSSVNLDLLFRERGFELYWELQRRTDMVRFGKYEGAWTEKTNTDKNKRIFPIPQTAIDGSSNLPDYLKQNFEQSQIIPDVVSSFSNHIIASITDANLLSQMIYFGKQLYLKDVLISQYTDAEKMGYTIEQLKWCEDNESYMWRYFIEKQMLYSNEQKLNNRFINPAPFSKFYLEIDNESPGRIGAWIGWQIVRSFMKNNDISIQEMLKMDSKELFEKSKYKPKK
jgi:hypothetical protein